MQHGLFVRLDVQRCRTKEQLLELAAHPGAGDHEVGELHRDFLVGAADVGADPDGLGIGVGDPITEGAVQAAVATARDPDSSALDELLVVGAAGRGSGGGGAGVPSATVGQLGGAPGGGE